MTSPTTNRPLDAIRRLILSGYGNEAERITQAIVQGMDSERMRRRFRDLESEARRLQSVGERLTPDNPFVTALLSDVRDDMQAYARLVRTVDDDIVLNAVNQSGEVQRRLAFRGLDPASIGVTWNVPDPEQIARVVQYADSEAWRNELSSLPQDVADVLTQSVYRGTVVGRNQLSLIKELREQITNVPVAKTRQMLRSLYLTSYRDAAVVHQVANAAIVERIVRVASLDGRACLTCLSLHGSELQIGERVDDHRNGRCTSIIIVKGAEQTVQTGQEWVSGLLEAERNNTLTERNRVILDNMRQTHGASMRALEDNAAQLNDFVRRGTDRVFGPIVYEASLNGVLGPDAKQYYSRRRR